MPLNVVSARPTSCAMIDQLHRYSHDSADLPVRPRQHGVYLEISSRLRRIVHPFRVLQNGVGRTNSKILQGGQSADDGIGHSDAPLLTTSVLREIAKRQYRESPTRTLRFRQRHLRCHTRRFWPRTIVPQNRDHDADHDCSRNPHSNYSPGFLLLWSDNPCDDARLRFSLETLEIGP